MSFIFPTLSGVGVDVTAGLNARITDSIYIYGQYEYENADKLRTQTKNVLASYR